MTTIVSAFINNNVKSVRSMDEYVELGIPLLKSNIPKVIFVDEIVYEKIKKYENDNTKIILYDKSESYLYQYINNEHLSKYSLYTIMDGSVPYDTIEYHFIQCNKTEWVKKAIDANSFNTDNFVWLDFGIRHVWQGGDEHFIKTVESIGSKNYNDKIRIASIWDVNITFRFFIFTHVLWYFAGGVFGGNAKSLLAFSQKMRDKCVEIILKENTIMWEVNIWYLIYKENPDMFLCYYGSHDNTIIENY
jgi:hypothetical protein